MPHRTRCTPRAQYDKTTKMGRDDIQYYREHAVSTSTRTKSNSSPTARTRTTKNGTHSPGDRTTKPQDTQSPDPPRPQNITNHTLLLVQTKYPNADRRNPETTLTLLCRMQPPIPQEMCPRENARKGRSTKELQLPIPGLVLPLMHQREENPERTYLYEHKIGTKGNKKI